MRAWVKKFILSASVIGMIVFLLFSGNWFGSWYLKLNYKAPYISITTGNASECIGISFETPLPCIANVYIGTDLTYSNFTKSDTSLTTVHHFNFTGLSPGTTYYYVVNSSQYTCDYMNKHYSFKTAPDSNNAHFKFGIVGDTRPDTFGHSGMEITMTGLMAHDPDFIINVGDIVMTSLRLDHWARFFQMVTMNDYGSEHPYMVSIGNHETIEYGGDHGLTFDRLFYFPDRNLYYAYNYSNTCFISLDLVIDSFLNPDPVGVSQAQLDWLTETLQEANASSEINWIIASWHVPAYSSAGDSETVKEKIMPILEQYKVDLILVGHHHFYERLSINNIPHIISGGGGAEIDPFVSSLSPYSQISKSGYQYCTVEITDTVLSFSAFDQNGIQYDTLTLQQNNPWRL
ncbi:MAG: metallophosphoesterase [Candidatus Helarchaeota archaeon]